MTDTTHAAILGLGSSLASDATFPLIMIVGREPSATTTETVGIGRYTFWKDSDLDDPKDHVSNCAFWNTAYTVMARSIGLNGGSAGAAKELCKPLRRSPVIFSDVMPVGLRNEIPSAVKNVHRDALLAERTAAHIEEVFSHRAIISRTQLVLLSGHNASDGLKKASALYENACRKRRIPVQSVPFMYGTNTPRIMESLTAESKAIIRSVWKTVHQTESLSA